MAEPTGSASSPTGSASSPTGPASSSPATTAPATSAVTASAAGAVTTGEPADRGANTTTTERLDVALVHRGLARSRTHAAKLVTAGRVRIGDRPVTRASRPVTADETVTVEGARTDADGADTTARTEVDWVSRGGVKLDLALDALAVRRAPGVPVTGMRCLDAGASTGGFTEVLLRRGAAHVEAVDVGHEQLARELGDDPRVTDREGTSVRGLVAADVGGPVDLLVADLSFISLRTVLPDLVGLVRPGGHQVLMVKPQFEVGRAKLPRGGVVRDAGLRVEAVQGVASVARELGWQVVAAVPSALPGPAGNVEFFLWLTSAPATGADPTHAGLGDDALARIVREAG